MGMRRRFPWSTLPHQMRSETLFHAGLASIRVNVRPLRILARRRLLMAREHCLLLLHDHILREAVRFRTELEQQIEPAKDPERDLFAPDTDADARRWAQAAGKMLPLLTRKEELEAELLAARGETAALTTWGGG